MRRISIIVAAIMVLGQSFLFAASVTLAPAEIDDLNSLFALLDTKLNKQNLQFLRGKIPSSSLRTPASTLASVILYAEDPGKYEDQLYKVFSIHDYAERGKGNYNLISREQMLSDVHAIESQFKDKISDGRASLLLSFCLYRDQNKWIVKDSQRISLARFFRSAFLSSVLQGKGIDVVELTNKVDKRAEIEDLKQ